MNINDLPDHITVMLLPHDGIAYPLDGEMQTTYEVTMYCFTAKQYLKTWPLRQRIMQSFAKITTDFADLGSSETAEDDADGISALQFKQMMLMSNFDLPSAIEDFKQLAVGGKLVFLDDAIHLTKERWNNLPDTTKETLCFEYLAAFIQPCVI